MNGCRVRGGAVRGVDQRTRPPRHEGQPALEGDEPDWVRRRRTRLQIGHQSRTARRAVAGPELHAFRGRVHREERPVAHSREAPAPAMRPHIVGTVHERRDGDGALSRAVRRPERGRAVRGVGLEIQAGLAGSREHGLPLGRAERPEQRRPFGRAVGAPQALPAKEEDVRPHRREGPGAGVHRHPEHAVVGEPIGAGARAVGSIGEITADEIRESAGFDREGGHPLVARGRPFGAGGCAVRESQPGAEHQAAIRRHHQAGVRPVHAVHQVAHHHRCYLRRGLRRVHEQTHGHQRAEAPKRGPHPHVVIARQTRANLVSSSGRARGWRRIVPGPASWPRCQKPSEVRRLNLGGRKSRLGRLTGC